MKETDFKVKDNLIMGGGSRLETYWKQEGMYQFFKYFRKGVDQLPKTLSSQPANQEAISKRYALRGFQFGNWVTNEDRYNYLSAMYICLFDLNKVLKFKNNNIGLGGSLGIAFGARGHGKATAHFEPNNHIINITRYSSDTDISKKMRFLRTGGVGAFAHEYGHFLDAYFGRFYEPSKFYYNLTAGAFKKHNRNMLQTTPMRKEVENIIQIAYWSDEKKQTKSSYIKRLEAQTDNPYWFAREEIFARLFEQYISNTLQKMGVYNKFLTQTKYDVGYYMNPAELKKVTPHFDRLIAEMRKYF